MDKGHSPLSAFLDLSKAFDTINHDILLDKLHDYGIKGNRNRKQYPCYNDTNSDLQIIKTGVLQGSVLGPLMFIIYMNDFAKVSYLFKFINYADDSTLSSTLQTFGNLLDEMINHELLKVSYWLKVNKLSLDIEKTK